MQDEKDGGVIFNPKIYEEGKVDEFPQLNADPEEVKVEDLPEDGIAPEKKELTEEEKKEKFIKHLKDSKLVYHPRKKFGVAYHKKRKTKNKMQRQSRKNNR